MAYTNWFNIIMNGVLQGVTMQYRQIGFSQTLIPDPQAFELRDAIRSEWWESLQPLVSESYQMTTVETQIGTIGSTVYTTDTFVINETGLVDTSQSQASWMAVNFTRYPDNTLLSPTWTDPIPFKNGRIGIAGVPEIDVDGNYLTDAAMAIWEPVAQSWKELNPTMGGSARLLEVGLQRYYYTGTPPVYAGTVYTVVEDMHVAQKLGSRVGRKP